MDSDWLSSGLTSLHLLCVTVCQNCQERCISILRHVVPLTTMQTAYKWESVLNASARQLEMGYCQRMCQQLFTPSVRSSSGHLATVTDVAQMLSRDGMDASVGKDQLLHEYGEKWWTKRMGARQERNKKVVRLKKKVHSGIYAGQQKSGGKRYTVCKEKIEVLPYI